MSFCVSEKRHVLEPLSQIDVIGLVIQKQHSFLRHLWKIHINKQRLTAPPYPKRFLRGNLRRCDFFQSFNHTVFLSDILNQVTTKSKDGSRVGKDMVTHRMITTALRTRCPGAANHRWAWEGHALLGHKWRAGVAWLSYAHDFAVDLHGLVDFHGNFHNV